MLTFIIITVENICTAPRKEQHLFEIQIYCNHTNVFAVIFFISLNVSSLNKNINSLKTKKLISLTQQWAALYQPLTFHGDSHSDTAGEPLLNKLDPVKAFCGKAKPPTPKKKQAAQVPVSGVSTAKAQGVSGRHSMTKQ